MRTRHRWIHVLVVALFGVSLSTSVEAELVFHWQDEFTDAERQKLIGWVSEVAAGLETLVGPLPFDVHLRFHRRLGGGPVPWANTLRSDQQGVKLHVDPSHSLEDFRRDWTAPHELSHLVLPYLGSQHSWFAEGFASYMQYPVMQSIGVLSREEAAERYRTRLQRAESGYPFGDLPFVQATPQLRSEGKYPVMYWGGAAFFLQVNQALAEKNHTHLIEVLRAYLACCRRSRDTLDSLITELDRLARSKTFSEHLERFHSQPGFPRYRSINLGKENSS